MNDILDKWEHLKDKRIKIFTRSFSLELYKLSHRLYQELGIETVRLTDQMADGYFYTILTYQECDIAINIDEDAFLIDPQTMLSLADWVIGEGYANAGCPDGGVGCPRVGNPIVTNPFFNIFNLELIRSKYDLSAIKSFNYDDHKKEMIAAFPNISFTRGYDFEKIDYEPYYPFFLWLAYNFKTYYLNSQIHPDGLSTILYGREGQPFLLHSWFARFYKVTKDQTLRIDALIDEAYCTRHIQRVAFNTKELLGFKLDLLKRWSIKIPMRVMNWPNKWVKWYKRWKRNKNTASI